MGRRPYKSRAAKEGKKMGFLSVGSMVEVSTDEEGFKGACYVGKILESKYNRKDNILVQYQTLVSETNPNKLLTERTHISFIRPLPPPPAADQRYEVDDVVDAFYRDGWWKGTVREIVEGESESPKYSVVFETPPEKFDFYSKDLRFHYVWTADGEWVQSPKHKRMAGLNIDKGMSVEVNFDRDAWFPAIVAEEVGFNSFLVEYSGHMIETVDSFHIRPPPPKLDVQNFEALECVEAFHDSCWKKGTIASTSTKGRYNVFLISDKEIEFSQSDLRPHLMWLNGKWHGFRDIPQFADNIANHSNVASSSSAAKKTSSKRMSDGLSHSKEKSPVKKLRNDPLDTGKESDAFGHEDKGKCKNVCEDTAGKGTEFTISTENAVAYLAHTTNVGESSHSLNGLQGPGEDSNRSLVVTVQANSEAMPFTKHSPVWDHIDSLDVFKLKPQKPHFNPLFKVYEATRKSSAIYHMLSFSSLVETTSRLQDDVAQEVLDVTLESLAGLVLQGFDVKGLVEKIEKLLVIKSRQDELNNESEEIYREITECDGKKAEINKILRAVEIIRGIYLSEMEKLAEKSNVLRQKACNINEAILNSKLDFKSQVEAPW